MGQGERSHFRGVKSIKWREGVQINSTATPNQGGAIDGHPDPCSYRRRFGLLIPATKTTMENELWNILMQNRENGFTAPVLPAGRLLREF